ncbi:MAG TPA: phosphoribosylglycinamide formyltransferase [Tepidisphaeraceae bacterium]|jgi:formyltetrahydrofolate-dependent phosphoribosylglycinamide formyltransferase|nr:phosphoribosylglycinamide formyltransferase [Tepidisphaeraceae bacterium]
MPSSPINLAVLVSGSGTTLQNLIDQISAGKLDAKIKLVIGSKPGLVGVDRAIKANILGEIVDRKAFPDVSSFSRKMFELIDHAQVDLVCLAGWLCLLEFPDRYQNRLMNIHPALLPSFGGKGMYGAKVHQAVLDHGCKVSGCTVHFVDSAYDSGPIILQRTCPVMEGDTAGALAHRVFEEEKIAYPEAIRFFANGRLKVDGRKVHVVS